MAGYFDRNTLVILQHGWAALAASADDFATAVNDGSVQPNEVTAWHAALAPGGDAAHVKFLTGLSPRKMSNPQVGVRLIEESSDQQALGFALDPDDEEIVQALCGERVVIRTHTTHPSLTRALHAAVRAIMMANFRSLHQLGYIGLTYRGSQSLEPDASLFPNGDTVLYPRQQSWATRSKATAKTSTLAVAKDIVVAASDITLSTGIQGDMEVSS